MMQRYLHTGRRGGGDIKLLLIGTSGFHYEPDGIIVSHHNPPELHCQSPAGFMGEAGCGGRHFGPRSSVIFDL